MSLKDEIAAFQAKQAPGERKETAQSSSAEGSAASSQASAAETRATLPAKVRKETAQATIAEVNADKAKQAQVRQALLQRLTNLRGAEDTAGILTNIQQARDNVGPLSTGLPGQVMQHIWGSDSKNLHASLNSIMGPAVIEKLGQMKAQSASGASGFGALSEKELQLIKDSIAAIGQDQSSDQLQTNLNRLEEHYRRFQAYNAGVDPDTPEGAHAAGLAAAATDDDAGKKITHEGKWELNPKRAGMNSTIAAMVKSGRTADEIRAWADTIEPGLGARINNVDAAIADWKKTKRPSDVDVERDYVPQTDATKSAIGAAMNSAPGAFAAGSADAYTSGFADEGAADLAGQGTQAGNEAIFRGLQEEHPLPYMLGQGLGSIAQYATLGPLGGKYLSPFAKEMLQNTTYGAGSSQPGHRMMGGVVGGATGWAGDRLLHGAVKIPSAIIGGVDNPAAQSLINKGVRTTVGQTLGGGAKTIEDKMTSWPFIGPAITQRRRDAYRDFNQAAFDKALSFINGKTKNVGEAGVADAQDLVSGAYDKALKGTTITPDQPFVNGVQIAGVQKLAAIPNVGQELSDTVDRIVKDAIDPATGQISGERYQVLTQQLRDLRAGYKNERQFNLDIKPVLDDIDTETHAMFERQHPERAADFQAANTANRHVSILGEAVNNAPADADGIFTPAQLRNKSRQNAAVFGSKRQSARGNRPFFELDKAGRTTLPSSIPDSGTGSRMLLPLTLGAIAGGGTLAGEATDDEKGIDLASPILNTLAGSLIGGAPYSKLSQAMVRKLIAGDRSPTARIIGDLGKRYLAPVVATAVRPQSSGLLINRTPNPDVPYHPGKLPPGGPPVADASPTPEGATIDPATGEVVLPDGTRLPPPKGMAYGGAVRQLSQRYGCGG